MRNAFLLAAALAGAANADPIVDWNIKSGEIVAASRIGTPPAIRAMAVVQTAVWDAVKSAPAHDDAAAAAVAAAHRVTLAKLIPSQQAAIDAAYQAALAKIAEGEARAAGVAAGERAAELALVRAGDGAAVEAYRPHAAAGAYVPTPLPAALSWPQRTPWLMETATQFRPGPPPALSSEAWARDYNEVRTLGARASTMRTAEQTEIAQFWEFSLPSIYHGVVRSVAATPGRDAARNARLFAAVAQAMDDAMIAVFDAKYRYNFWRPSTAIRNGDIDGHDATERDPSWTPLIEAPLHPEYPSAHSILAGAVASILQAELRGGAVPLLATSSPTAKGAVRRWKTLDSFAREVADARVYEGIHYRNSTEVGLAMGRQIGALAAAKHLGATGYAAVQVPAELSPGANQSLAMVVPAKGVQIYECREGKWAFVAPDADLFDISGKRIGTHYAGPHWEAADGSRIVGAVKARTDAPEAGAIPWLLLGAKSVGPDGAFSKVTNIQRVTTTGGVAPAGGCTQPGSQARVAYTADYYFFTSR
jgi:hypothetical protein